MKPKISVVIAAYNEERLIEKCLKALKNQKFPHGTYEILVIDNNSTDNTAKISRKMGAKVLSYTEKQGAAFAKHYGALLAESDIIAFTDSDSFPEPDWLENIYALFQNKQLVCVGGTMIPLGGNSWIEFLFALFDYFSVINQWCGITMLWGSNLAVRKDAYRKVNGINTKLKTGDDWEFVKRLGAYYGRGSTLYSQKLRVYTSPRKQESMSEFLPYCRIGTTNYFLLYFLGSSQTFGVHKNVR
jgi:glycosyltransferase involved in cell wall biosynthesis